MNATLLVMAGGALGAGARYHLGRLLFHFSGPGFPYGTLAANLFGGLLMGVLVGILARNDFAGEMGGEPWRLFIGVGLLGGFTTFSAFSLEVMNMIDRGSFGMAAGYALLSVCGSVLALFGGLLAVRSLI